MKGMIFFLLVIFSSVVFADYKVICQSSSNFKYDNPIKATININKSTISIKVPKAAYLMNGDAPGYYSENCQVVMYQDSVKSFGCYELDTFIKLPKEMIYAISFFEGNHADKARAYLDKLASSNKPVYGEFNCFENSEDGPDINLSSASDDVTCRVENK